MDKLSKEPQSNIDAVISRLSFHVHEDIEEAAKWYKIPLALYNSYDVYIKDEKVGITSDILIELNPIDSDMNSIRNDLSKIFSIM